MDRFRTFQIASGIFLAAYVLGHMNSVFVFARLYLGIDSDWAFATGAPSGLIKDAWNIRLVPHYGLAVFFVLSHLAAGGRSVLLAHGVSSAFCGPLPDRQRHGRWARGLRHHVRHVRRTAELRHTLIGVQTVEIEVRACALRRCARRANTVRS